MTLEPPISRRAALAQLGLAAVATPALLRGRYSVFTSATTSATTEYSARCIKLVEENVVVDLLNQFRFQDFAEKPPRIDRWLTQPGSLSAADADIYRGSKMTAVALGHAPGSYEEAIRFFADWNGLVAGYSDWFTRIDDASDFARAKASNKLGIMITFQDSHHFRRPDDVNTFWGLGQRVSQLTYNSRNLIGNGSTERRDEGISDFGVRIIERMNTVGMAVDVSHCGDRTTLDAFELSKRPVLITHSNCRALAPGHPRCKTDDAIRAVGKAGSVMGITGVRMFVKVDEPTTVENVLDHYDHVRKLIGPEHLGVGSDISLEGYDDMPPEMNKQLRAGYKGSYGFREKIDVEGLSHPKRMFDLTEGLIRRKYSDAEIEGVLGGNFIRVLSEVWKT